VVASLLRLRPKLRLLKKPPRLPKRLLLLRPPRLMPLLRLTPLLRPTPLPLRLRLLRLSNSLVQRMKA
jgi:hypothetical protein